MVSNIELFLNYCTRYHDRQFITRDNVNKGILEKFEDLLSNYFSSDRRQLLVCLQYHTVQKNCICQPTILETW
jgi:hypothetical protein